MTQSSGLLASVRVLFSTLLGIAQTRLELLANELEEERLRLTRLFVYGFLALFFFGLGVLALSLLAVAAFWDTHRLAAIAGVSLVHLGIAFTASCPRAGWQRISQSFSPPHWQNLAKTAPRYPRSMSNLEQIAARRAALIERAARQRAELGAVCSQFQRPAAIFDKGYAMACRIKSHSGIAIGATAVLALLLIKRGAIGKLAGVAVKAARFVVPVARFWLSRKLPSESITLEKTVKHGEHGAQGIDKG